MSYSAKNTQGWRAAAYLENRDGGGGQELGGRHVTQRGRRKVVIGGTFRRDVLSLEGLLTHGGTFLRDFSSLEGA